MMLEPARVLYEACGDLLGWQLAGSRMLRWRTLSTGVRRNLRNKADRRKAPPGTIDEATAALAGVGVVTDRPSRTGARKQT